MKTKLDLNIDQLFLKTKKTDNSDFLKDYQNSHKVGEKPVDLRNEQLVTPVFESQNRLDPKKQRFLRTFRKFAKKKGTTDAHTEHLQDAGYPLSFLISKKPTTGNIQDSKLEEH